MVFRTMLIRAPFRHTFCSLAQQFSCRHVTGTVTHGAAPHHQMQHSPIAKALLGNPRVCTWSMYRNLLMELIRSKISPSAVIRQLIYLGCQKLRSKKILFYWIPSLIKLIHTIIFNYLLLCSFECSENSLLFSITTHTHNTHPCHP